MFLLAHRQTVLFEERCKPVFSMSERRYIVVEIDKRNSLNKRNEITICRPDDWHLHVRDGAFLNAVVPYTAKVFGRAIIMPNLTPPVITVAGASAYRDRILSSLVDGEDFEPLMTAYLTDVTDPAEIARGHENFVFTAAKLYPAGATTNSDNGVTDIANISRVLETMEKIGMPLLVHGEVTDPDIDIFDREKVFIDRTLEPTLQRFPDLKVVFEHITTKEAVDFVKEAGSQIAATILLTILLLIGMPFLLAVFAPICIAFPSLSAKSTV